jgi:hypothetical protein
MGPHVVTYYALAVALLGLLFAGFYSQRKSIKLSDRGWEDVLSHMQVVNTAGLTAVAMDYLNPPQHQTSLQPRELWKLVGAYDGLSRMRANADLMLALAAHAANWNFEEATIVAERMRRDALRLRRAVLKIEVGFLPIAVFRHFYVRTPFHIQEAAAAYYLMRQRLLALYAATHSARYPVLAAVL